MDAIDAKPLPARPNLEQYKKQAKDLLKARRATGDSASTLSDTQLTIAREHGFTSWPKFAQHLAGLADGPTKRYEAAVDAIVTGDLPALESLLREDSELVRRRSTRVHGATLLHYVAANGVEQYRQKTPPNAVEIAGLLLRQGADPEATARVYGEADTTMGLLVSSVHPAKAGVQVALVNALVDAGAAPNGPDDDGEPLLTAVLFQYVPAANALIERGARVDTVVTAAGLGREALVREMVDESGTLRPGVRLARVGVPKPRQDPRANLEWALASAAGLGHPGVVDFLAGCGVDLSTRTFAGFTALHWAAVNAHLEVVDVLLAYGAQLEDTANSHHSTVLGCARWAAGQGLPDAPAVIDRLLAAGARDD
jgi:ankyrin repeat protein